MKSDLSPLARFSHRELRNLTIAKMSDPTPHCPSCHTLALCPWGLSQHPQTHPVSSWPLKKLKQLLGGLSIQGTKKLTLWYCVSLPL